MTKSSRITTGYPDHSRDRLAYKIWRLLGGFNSKTGKQPRIQLAYRLSRKVEKK